MVCSANGGRRLRSPLTVFKNRTLLRPTGRGATVAWPVSARSTEQLVTFGTLPGFSQTPMTQNPRVERFSGKGTKEQRVSFVRSTFSVTPERVSVSSVFWCDPENEPRALKCSQESAEQFVGSHATGNYLQQSASDRTTSDAQAATRNECQEALTKPRFCLLLMYENYSNLIVCVARTKGVPLLYGRQ